MLVGVILQSHQGCAADKTDCLCLVESGIESFRLIFGWLDFFVSNTITYQKFDYF